MFFIMVYVMPITKIFGLGNRPQKKSERPLVKYASLKRTEGFCDDCCGPGRPPGGTDVPRARSERIRRLHWRRRRSEAAQGGWQITTGQGVSAVADQSTGIRSCNRRLVTESVYRACRPV